MASAALFDADPPSKLLPPLINPFSAPEKKEDICY
jgi:hypothetical protein